MSKGNFEYTGTEVLEAIAEAKNYNEYLIKFVKNNLKNRKVKILDFGAGSGTYADMLKSDGILVDCLEPDTKLQKVLTKKRYKVTSDIKKLKPNSYDVIYSLNVFEHIEDDFDAFEKLSKVLTKNGIIIIYVPAFQSIYSSLDKLVEHHRRYRKSRLSSMANENKLEIVKLQYCDPIGYFAAAGFKASGNKTGVPSIKSVKLYDKFAFPISKSIEPVFKNIIGKNVVLIAQKTPS